MVGVDSVIPATGATHGPVSMPSIVMSIVIVVFGIISFTFLGVREYPAIDPAVITVSTSYTGANSDVIESQITEPLDLSQAFTNEFIK